MTINPVDMQVLLPQTGQVNRLQRGLQQQQQTEQQILGQMNTHELKNKENTVKKSEQTAHKKIRDDNQNKKEKREEQKGQGQSKKDMDKETGKKKVGGQQSLGSHFDIKI